MDVAIGERRGEFGLFGGLYKMFFLGVFKELEDSLCFLEGLEVLGCSNRSIVVIVREGKMYVFSCRFLGFWLWLVGWGGV